MRAKVDADHTADTVTRRSRMGFLVYLNSGVVYWWSKKQTDVELSSFGSEFIVMKQCCEYMRGLRYKLWMMEIIVMKQCCEYMRSLRYKLQMMGIPVVGPVYIYGDDQSVFVDFWGLPPLILFFNMSIGWFGRFVLATEWYRTRKLGYKNLNWPRCSARVTESLALTDGSFCQK